METAVYLACSPATLVLLLFAFACFYAFVLVLYRLLLHPLAFFPGPKIAAATYWYECYFDVFKAPQGQYMYEIDRLHEIYGPVVRINPGLLHVKDSEFFDSFVSGRRDRWGIKPTGAPGSTSSTNPHDLHRIRRAPLNPFFSKRAATQLEPVIETNIEQLCHQLEDYCKNGKIVDLEAAFTALTLDTITKYAFDISYHCLDSPEFAPEWGRTMKGLFDAVPTGRLSPWLAKQLRHLPLGLIRIIKPAMVTFVEGGNTIRAEAVKVHDEYTRSSLEKGIQDPNKAKTIFHSLLYSNLPESEKAVGRISDEAYVLIVAGTHTTARVLLWIIYHILSDQQLLADLRLALGDAWVNGIPETTKPESIPLLKAVVQEALRMAAPLANRLSLIAPNDDLYRGDVKMPAGTPISMTYRDVLYDPEIFPEPNTFDPGRWLRAAEKGGRLDKYLVAFGKGSRICLGQNLAYAEIYAATAALVTRYDMQLFDTIRERDLDTVRDMFMALPSKESKGVRVKIQRRA